MPYTQGRPRHCKECPLNTEADEYNPHVCRWTVTQELPYMRREVIRIVTRLMHNNPEPWCNLPRPFRMVVVRAAVFAATERQQRENVPQSRVVYLEPFDQPLTIEPPYDIKTRTG